MVRGDPSGRLSAAEFERLWPGTLGRRIEKTRFRIREGTLLWELDRFHDLPLVMLEVELPSVDAAASCQCGRLVVREVTEDARYRNAALAIDGLPRNG